VSINKIEDEREKDIKESITVVRKDMLAIDKQLGDLIDRWRDDYGLTRANLAQIRMIFTKDIRLVDKLDGNVFFEEKIEAVGFCPKTMGSDRKDIAKSDSSRNLVKEILRGNISASKAAETLRPKYARNE
jgi:hypothetical protein